MKCEAEKNELKKVVITKDIGGWPVGTIAWMDPEDCISNKAYNADMSDYWYHSEGYDCKWVEKNTEETMRIEEGKYYETRSGKKVGPAEVNWSRTFPWNIPHDGHFHAYTPQGEPCLSRFLEDNEDNIVGEWVEKGAEEMTYKTWGEMTPEEKGALLLAHHEGKVIEYSWYDTWYETDPGWYYNLLYRVKPEEPKVEEKVFDEVYLEVNDIPYTYSMEWEGVTKGTATVTYTDGKPTKMVWEST